MKSVIMKSFVLFMAILLFCSVFPLSAAALDHNQYWPLQKAYQDAVAAGNKTAITAAAEDILKLYGKFEDATACYRSISPILNAAKIYEEQGRFDDAQRLYQAYRRCYQALDRLTDDDVEEALRYADAMLDAAKRNNRILQLGLLSRFAPCWQKIKSLIDAGEIGEVMSITMTHYWNQTTLYTDWRTKTSVSGGGIIADSAVHWIDIMRWLLGEMTELTAIGAAAPDSPKQDVDDTAMVLFHFKNGQIGTLRNSWRHMRPSNEAETVEIYGTKGTIIGNLQTPWINGGIQHVRLVQPGETKVYTYQNPKERYANQLNTFFDLVESRDCASASGPDGRRALEIQLAIYEAMAKRSWVRV